ncbi:MAG: lysophospholipid acyltransferase family protein [Phycisphaerales bacterium]|nr:lysophospholipid acyltransferase family protein [Phycisphaerales bacterium]
MAVKRRSGLVAYLAYLAVRIGAFILQMFPLEANLRTMRFFGGWCCRLDRRRRTIARENLHRSLPELSNERLDAVTLRCFQHFAMLFGVELLCGFRAIDEWTWPRHVRLVNLQETVKLLLRRRGAILLTGHYGNFELTAYMLAALGFDAVAVMRPLDNVYLNRFLVATRGARGLKLLDKFGATTEAEDVLRRGGALGFVADQDAGRKGVFVDFFGRPASTYKSIALLAMTCDVPIVVGYARRIGDGFHYDLGVERIIQPEEWRGRDDPLTWITQEYTRAIESFVRAAPEQYLWLHRRWKTRPRNERPAAGGATVPAG